MQDSLPAQVKCGSSISQPLDQLEASDLPCYEREAKAERTDRPGVIAQMTLIATMST
jgi:hypothetical protein